MQNSQWIVDDESGQKSSPKSNRKKVPHYIEVKITEEMDDNTKVWYERFNTMRKRLIELGEMDSK